jgi:hypothetical protein
MSFGIFGPVAGWSRVCVPEGLDVVLTLSLLTVSLLRITPYLIGLGEFYQKRLGLHPLIVIQEISCFLKAIN